MQSSADILVDKCKIWPNMSHLLPLSIVVIDKVFKVLFKDEMGSYRERASDFLRRYLRELDASRDVPEPSLSVPEVRESASILGSCTAVVAVSERYRTAWAPHAAFIGMMHFPAIL